MIIHYLNDSSEDLWRKEMDAMWAEDECSPIQRDPPEEADYIFTPMLLRRQAA